MIVLLAGDDIIIVQQKCLVMLMSMSATSAFSSFLSIYIIIVIIIIIIIIVIIIPFHYFLSLSKLSSFFLLLPSSPSYTLFLPFHFNPSSLSLSLPPPLPYLTVVIIDNDDLEALHYVAPGNTFNLSFPLPSNFKVSL